MYSDKIKDMVWSYSRLSAFAQCKYQFYLNYIVNDHEEYLPEGNFYAEVGSYVHMILEKIFKNELNVDDAAQYFVDHFDDNVFYKTRPSIMDKSFAACADYFANLSLNGIDNYDIVGVEKEINVEIGGYKFTGYIDLLLRDKRDGEYIVVDHKSAKYPCSKKTNKVLKSSERSFESYKKQMYLYCNAVKQTYGKFPKLIVWNHFKDSACVQIPFNQEEYERAMQWFLDTIHCIEAENDYGETTDFFYCHNICSFRNSCEYAKYANTQEE